MFRLDQRGLGNMAEYILPAVLIGLVAMGGLAWTVSGQFAQNGAMAVYQGKALVSTGQGKFAVQTQALGTNPTLSNFSYVTATGKKITLPNLPANILQSIEVNGGQGTMDQLSASIRALAEQLLLAGEIDLDQANAIKALADSGFDIGKDLGAFDQAMVRCNYQAAFTEQLFSGAEVNNQPNSLDRIHGRLSANNTTLDAQSKEYFSQKQLTPGALKGMEALFGPGSEIYNLGDCGGCAMTQGTTMMNFYEAYGRVSNLQLPAESKMVLHHLTSVIAQVSQRQSAVFREISITGQGTVDNQRVAAKVGEYLEKGNISLAPPSFLVNDKSAKICTVGNGEVQQGQCH